MLLTIAPKRKIVFGYPFWWGSAALQFSDGEIWDFDGSKLKKSDGEILFQIKSYKSFRKNSSGYDVVFEGQQFPLLRVGGFVQQRTTLFVQTSEFALTKNYAPNGSRFSWGLWNANYDSHRFSMFLDLEKGGPDFPFVLAGACALWQFQVHG